MVKEILLMEKDRMCKRNKANIHRKEEKFVKELRAEKVSRGYNVVADRCAGVYTQSILLCTGVYSLSPRLLFKHIHTGADTRVS